MAAAAAAEELLLGGEAYAESRLESASARFVAYCSDGTQFGDWLYWQTHGLVHVTQWIPAILGIVLGEVVFLYVGSCYTLLMLWHALLTEALADQRPCATDGTFASPCRETVVMWNFTTFVFAHQLLRAITDNSTLRRADLMSLGKYLFTCAALVTWAVVSTGNNTLEQSLLGALVGVTYGAATAVYLEYFWSAFIPTLLRTFPFSRMHYVDTIYSGNVRCPCRRSRFCPHVVGHALLGYSPRPPPPPSTTNMLPTDI